MLLSGVEEEDESRHYVLHARMIAAACCLLPLDCCLLPLLLVASACRPHGAPLHPSCQVALPVFFFVPMAMLQFSVPRSETANRLSVSLAIVLTAVAHKYSMMALVPQLSYMVRRPHRPDRLHSPLASN